MAYRVRLMQLADVSQVENIDRECFPSMWPTNYSHELDNQMAHYIVVYDDTRATNENIISKDDDSFTARLKKLFSHPFPAQPAEQPKVFVVGFVGFWIMAGEAHITAIGVRETHRGLGIGELLMLSAVELAHRLNARMMTLEVRYSNEVAQALYRKYGFIEVGIRKNYYHDGEKREDAKLMTLDNLASPEVQANIAQLKAELGQRHGIISQPITTQSS